MSDKFDMKVVIDAVTTPLLHARLGAARSYRERAALLRSLAESALRGVQVAPSVMPDPAASTHHVASITPDSVPTAGNGEPVVSGSPVRPLPDSHETFSKGHDILELADQFAGYLGVDA